MVLEGYSQRKLAKETGIGVNVLNKKIHNNGVFRCDEVDKICKVLNITSTDDKCNIFFAEAIPQMG